MADIEANIILRTSGGDESAAEIQKASAAIQNVTSASSGLEGQFQHRFQHIGLMLFAGDALRASGLGAETRQVINTMNLALGGAAEAFGLAGGPVLLFVTALTALIAVASKVSAHNKDQTDSLIKLSDQSLKNVTTTDEEIAALERLKESLGKLPPSMQALLDADERLRQQQLRSLEVTNQQLIASLNLRIAKQKDLVEAEKEESEQLQKSADQLSKYLKPGMEGYTMLERTSTQYNDAVKKLQTDTLKLNTDEAQLNRTISQQVSLLHGNIQSFQQEGDAASKAEEKKTKALHDYVKNLQDAAKIETDLQKQIDADKVDQQNKAYATMEKRDQKYTTSLTREFASAYDKILKSQEDWGQAMLDMFVSMIEKMISEVLALITVWSILDIVSGGVTGSPINPGSLSSFMGSNFKFATGGSVFADKPTLAVFGEGGPEVATFTPLSGGGSGPSGSGNGDMNFGNIYVSVSGTNNPDDIARVVGQKIVQQIRGQGQISFVRG